MERYLLRVVVTTRALEMCGKKANYQGYRMILALN